MSLSKRARKDLAKFAHIQQNTQAVKYHFHQKKIMLDLNAVPAPVVQAAVDAISKMRENANAIQKLSKDAGHPESENPEGRTEHSVPVQPQSSSESAEGTDAGAPGGAK